MHVINVRNVHEALPVAIDYILRHGLERESRAGDVLVAPHPVATVYQNPTEVCCFWPERDVNPFATLFEGLWMLAGRNDVEYVARFIARMREFSDDGETLHGAYGERWRRRFGLDQLKVVADALRENPDCRRQMVQIWDASTDLGRPGRDFPCNTMIHFQVNPYGALDMSVFNRSNDLVWGTYGADAPHFGMLLEYMAARVGVRPGRYWQISDNWHAYKATLEPLRELQLYAPAPFYEHHRMRSPYHATTQPYGMMQGVDPDQWDSDLAVFLDEEDACLGYQTPFIRKVALPLIQAHNAFKQLEGEDRYKEAARALQNCQARDWRTMAEQWIHRRWEKFLGKANQSG